MLQAAVGLAITSIKCAVWNAQQFRRLLHLQVLVLNRIQHALRKRLFPELRSSSFGQIIIHPDNVVPLLPLIVGQKDWLQMLSWTAQNIFVLLLGEIVWRIGAFNFRRDLVTGWIWDWRWLNDDRKSEFRRVQLIKSLYLLRTPPDDDRSRCRAATAYKTNAPRCRATCHPSSPSPDSSCLCNDAATVIASETF